MTDPQDGGKQLEIYREQRLTRVEERVDTVTIRQTQQQTVIDKLATFVEAIMRQNAVGEMTVKAIVERTDQHTKTIEHLQERESDISTILKGMELQLNLLRYVGGVVITIIIGYFFSHFIH